MVQLTRIAEKKGLTKEGTSLKIEDVLKRYNLPTKSNITTNKLYQAINLDKKNINKKLSYILLNQIGDAYVYPDDLSFIEGEEV